MPALITFVLRLFSCCTTTLLHAARTSDLRSLVNGDVPVGAARWICASSKLNKIIIQQSTRHLMQMTSRAERCQHESRNRRAAAKQQPRWPTSSSQASNLRSAHRVKTAAAALMIMHVLLAALQRLTWSSHLSRCITFTFDVARTANHWQRMQRGRGKVVFGLSAVLNHPCPSQRIGLDHRRWGKVFSGATPYSTIPSHRCRDSSRVPGFDSNSN